MKHNYIIGIDFGNTLTYKLSEHDEETRQLFPDAARVVKWLVDQWPVHIVSKVNARQQEEVEAWLKKHDFLKCMGIPSANLHFCANRTDKYAICEKVGITHHIDDRPEVFSVFSPKVKGFLFRPIAEDVVKHYDILKHLPISIVHRWEDVAIQFSDYTNFPFV